MHLSGVSLVLGATIGVALAVPQGLALNSLPQCAETASASLIQSAGCSLLDIRCMCRQQSFIQTLESTIRGECGQADVDAAISFGQAECAAVGIPLTISASSDSVSSTTTSLGATSITSTLLGVTSTTTPTSIAPSSTPTITATVGNTTWNGTIVSPSPFTGAAESFKMGSVEATGLVGVALAFAFL